MVWTFYCVSTFAFWAWGDPHYNKRSKCVLLLFFFFSTRFRSNVAIVHVLFMNSSRKCWHFLGEQCTNASFTDPQISLFSNFFIKNGSYGTIHTFKKYFDTMFSVSAKISSIQTDPKSTQNNLKSTQTPLDNPSQTQLKINPKQNQLKIKPKIHRKSTQN